MLKIDLFSANTTGLAIRAPNRGDAAWQPIRQSAAHQPHWLGLPGRKAASKLCRALQRCHCLERQGAPDLTTTGAAQLTADTLSSLPYYCYYNNGACLQASCVQQH